MTEDLTEVGRLALRVEGDVWRAYYAAQSTMEGAIEIASIHMRLVQNPERREQFMELARGCLEDLFRELTGDTPAWRGPEQAPEHERAGKA